MDKVDLKYTQNEFKKETSSLSLDLTALFNIIQDDILEILAQAEEENWDEDRTIKKIEEII